MDTLIGFMAFFCFALQVIMQALLVVTLKQHHPEEYYRVDEPTPFLTTPANAQLTWDIILGRYRDKAPTEVLSLYHFNRVLLIAAIVAFGVYIVI